MTASAPTSQDSGLVKRGLILLTILALVVIFVFTQLLPRAVKTVPAARQRPELLATALLWPGSGFPGTVDWLDLYRIGEAYPSRLGWRIRYNAATTLARRGSA